MGFLETIGVVEKRDAKLFQSQAVVVAAAARAPSRAPDPVHAYSGVSPIAAFGNSLCSY